MRLSSVANQVSLGVSSIPDVASIGLAVMLSKLRGNGDAETVLQWATSDAFVGGGKPPATSKVSKELSEVVKKALEPPPAGCVRMYGWELSYFSGKVRGYLRFKARVTPGFTYEEVVTSPEVVAKVLVPATHSKAVPQIQLPGKGFVQDSTEIIDAVEAMLPGSVPVIPSAADRPQQRLACELIEMLGDEWLLTPAYHWRWAYSGNGSAAQRMPAYMGGADPLPNHREHNEKQWGEFLRPGAPEADQRRTARWLFDTMLYSNLGIKRGMVTLGVTDATVAGWEASCRNVLGILERHFAAHDFVLGGRPSTADYGLLGPLYAHLYRDRVPGEMLRREFPRVTAWVERAHDRGGAAERGPAEWLPNDEVPGAVVELLQVFFTEFWPVLGSTCRLLTAYLRGGGHTRGAPLPGKSFSAEITDQMGDGPLSHDFSLPFDTQGRAGGVSRGRRMVVPYHAWMLQRVAAAVAATPPGALRPLLARVRGGAGLMELPAMLRGCRVRKVGALLYAADEPKSKL